MPSLFVSQVNYGKVSNESRKRLQFTVSRGCSPEFVFVPCGSSVAVYILHTGELVTMLRGHYNNVDCCEFHPDYQVSHTKVPDCYPHLTSILVYLQFCLFLDFYLYLSIFLVALPESSSLPVVQLKNRIKRTIDRKKQT